MIVSTGYSGGGQKRVPVIQKKREIESVFQDDEEVRWQEHCTA
jgi:hypothetical protein